MKHHEKNRFGVLVASLLGTLGIPACGSSASEPHTTGGPGASGGSSAAGGSGTTCPPDVTPVVRQATEAGNEGGANAVGNILCFPNRACFAPAVATPGLSFVHFAFANVGASSDGMPLVSNDSGVMNANVSYPEPGTICMSGDDGASLALRLRNLVPWDGTNLPPRGSADANFRAEELGITAVSFSVETPPSTGVAPSFTTFDRPCGEVGWGDAVRDDNPLVITSSGTTITLSFATDFTSFDTNAIGGLNFTPGAGEYDFCVRNLKFLDANGDEVSP